MVIDMKPDAMPNTPKVETKSSEFKYVLSYQNADKNFGSGDGIHITVRGDDFNDTFSDLKDSIPVMETLSKKKPDTKEEVKEDDEF